MRWEIAAVTVLAGCAGQQTFSAPAPAGALDCAVREAEEIGYRRLSSGGETGVRLGKYLPAAPAREAQGPRSATGTDPDLGDAVLHARDDGPLESQFRVWYEGGQLRAQVLSEREDPSVETRVTGDVSEDARRIVAQCAV